MASGLVVNNISPRNSCDHNLDSDGEAALGADQNDDDNYLEQADDISNSLKSLK